VRSISLSILTSERRETVAYSAKAETPMWWLTGAPLRVSRRSPESSVPAPFAAAAGSHNAGRPPAQGVQCLQPGTNTSTAWSPRHAVRSCGM
jgi:hypothetical protein